MEGASGEEEAYGDVVPVLVPLAVVVVVAVAAVMAWLVALALQGVSG